MWGFSEKHIEDWLTRPARGSQSAIVRIDGEAYVVLWSQAKMKVPDSVRPNPQPPLFSELRGCEGFCPKVDGEDQYPDLITYRKPKTSREIVVFELKAVNATAAHVAQLRRYMNLAKFHLDHDVDDFRRRLGFGRPSRVTGILLAPFIPPRLWLECCTQWPSDGSAPDIQLVAYELQSKPGKPAIGDIKFLNWTNRYRKEWQKIGRRYGSLRRKRKGQDTIPGLG